MPFSAKNDAENYWRTRYGRPLATTVRALQDGKPGSYGDMLRDETPGIYSGGASPLSGTSLRDAVPLEKPPGQKKRLIKNSFPAARPRRLRYWFVIPFGGLTAVAFITMPPSENGAPLNRPDLPPAAQGAIAGSPAPALQFDAALRRFLEAHEASLVALRGFLLTDGEGFRTEWLDATLRMQSAMNALDAHSASWTDGQRLVELVEAKRIVAQLLAEERAVASIVGSPNRYPGLQIFRADIVPALAEAQEISAAVMSAMLAVSSPDSVGPVGPFAAFRGDLETLREDLARYVAAPATHAPPASSRAEYFAARREMLTAIRAEAPADMRPRIDRLIALMSFAEDKLSRILALQQGERWDYASFAFRTRVMPLAARLEDIAARWTPPR